MKHELSALIAAGMLLTVPQGSVLAATGDKAQINITINVTARTCSFDNSTPMIQLEDVSTAKFRHSGTSMVSGKNVDIDIQCGSGIENVKIVPTGLSAAGDATAFANTGSAKNVGLRLMAYQGSAMLYPDGSAYVTVSPSDGVGSYRFKAGYVATGGPVRAGDFMAVVNLSFDYS
ncbi:fimbrial protein [Serratia grimesii]|uniref:fimbrial protein n=1 Tax=Serratia grimesii TaxID=82995 RepID=UPI0039AEFFDD